MSEEENKKMETDSSDETESSDDEQEKELQNRAEELENQISGNKYLYDAHVELIEVYQKLADLSSLRVSYERFQELFPLTPTIWLGWIRDEMKVANTNVEKSKILDLFKKAVEDYMSVELWQEYAQFSIGCAQLVETREILNKGLNVVGLHVTEASLLWDTLREIELAHLSIHEQNSEPWKQQMMKIADAFKRQLSVPLLDMENTYEEFKVWLEMLPSDHGIDVKSIEWGYKKALKNLETYKPFEERLLSAENEDALLQVFKEYIAASKDPSFILCLYERAICQFCLNVTLWEDYLSYCIKLGEVAASVSARALRNCPWSEDLWTLRMRILEHQKMGEKLIMECFEQGLTSISPSPGLELWLTYLEYAHRNFDDHDRLNKLFEKAHEQLWGPSDPTCKVGRLHARIAAKNGDVETGRKLWGDMVHILGKNNANTWQIYANFERQYGQPHNVRGVYQKALNLTTDWPQCIADDWLMFEREVGSLDDVLKCLEKCKFLKTTAQQMNYEQTEQQTYDKTKDRTFRKRTYDRDENNKASKRMKQSPKEPSMKNKNKKKIQEPEKDQEMVESAKNKNHQRITGPPSDLDHERSVFVSNLQYDVDENDLQNMFPSAVKISFAVDRKGASKCYAYIHLENPEDVEDALKRDREPLLGRPVFISRCKPDRSQRQPVFKYSTNVESNKLFIKNLPLSTTNEDLQEIYKPHGALSVRIVVHKSGQSKGIAYIDFADEDSANKALKETNGMEIGDRSISVAISAPPPKKASQEIPRVNEPSRHARVKLQTSFVPRGVQLKAKQASTETKDGKADEPPSKVIAKTNEDFRKMLLNK